jgi:hypothetical protein
MGLTGMVSRVVDERTGEVSYSFGATPLSLGS